MNHKELQIQNLSQKIFLISHLKKGKRQGVGVGGGVPHRRWRNDKRRWSRQVRLSGTSCLTSRHRPRQQHEFTEGCVAVREGAREDGGGRSHSSCWRETKKRQGWHDLRVIYKVPFRFSCVRKGRKRRTFKKEEENIFFSSKKRAALYSVAITAFFSPSLFYTHTRTRSHAHTHNFILVLLISNTSVKCSSYIYIYISWKELKCSSFLLQRTIYSIMNSNRHKNINIIMTPRSRR